MKLNNIIKGSASDAQILASDTILNIVMIKANIPKVARPTCHERPKNIPKPVATAFPPFQLNQTGQMWPIKEDNPTATCQESFNKKYLATKIDKTPLQTSIRKTEIAARLPMCRKTFVAPVDPEPNDRISIPFKILPAKYPLGKDPNK